MAASLTVSPTVARYGDTVTITAAGLTAGADYVLTTVWPGANRRGTQPFTTDGSGGWSTVIAPGRSNATFTFEVRPAAEHNGTTTAAASATLAATT